MTAAEVMVRTVLISCTVLYRTEMRSSICQRARHMYRTVRYGTEVPGTVLYYINMVPFRNCGSEVVRK